MGVPCLGECPIVPLRGIILEPDGAVMASSLGDVYTDAAPVDCSPGFSISGGSAASASRPNISVLFSGALAPGVFLELRLVIPI